MHRHCAPAASQPVALSFPLSSSLSLFLREEEFAHSAIHAALLATRATRSPTNATYALLRSSLFPFPSRCTYNASPLLCPNSRANRTHRELRVRRYTRARKKTRRNRISNASRDIVAGRGKVIRSSMRTWKGRSLQLCCFFPCWPRIDNPTLSSSLSRAKCFFHP